MSTPTTETPASSLLAFWRESRLRAADARPPGLMAPAGSVDMGRRMVNCAPFPGSLFT